MPLRALLARVREPRNTCQEIDRSALGQRASGTDRRATQPSRRSSEGYQARAHTGPESCTLQSAGADQRWLGFEYLGDGPRLQVPPHIPEWRVPSRPMTEMQ